MRDMTRAAPHYVTIDEGQVEGQVKVWRAGAGPSLVVLPGLAIGASVAATRLARLCPDWSITAIELPIGAGPIGSLSIDHMAGQVAATVKALGLSRPVLVAIDMAIALAEAVARQAGATSLVAVGASTARAWATRMPKCPPLAPQDDGTHLTTLFAHLRDLDVLEPRDAYRPALSGSAYLDADERHDTFLSWAAAPLAYAHMWALCATAMARHAGATAPSCATMDDIPPLLAQIKDRPLPAPPVPATRPTRNGIWYDHADVSDGRLHLRRAGNRGSKLPLIAFQSAPGSAAPLSRLIEGLAQDRQVVAPDYLGNGDSAKPLRKTDIALLARDALQLADRLGFDRFDLWGTHTGAVIALEAALIAPERVNRAVLEAPPLLPADFSADILANYLPPFAPDSWGLHVQRAWNMRRDMFLFWPWYREARTAVRPLGLPGAETLHDWTVGLLKSGRTYDLSYRAAFEYDTARRLPLIKCPALVCAGPADMLADGLDRARKIGPAHLRVAPTPATVWYPNQSPQAIAETIATYATFLSGD